MNLLENRENDVILFDIPSFPNDLLKKRKRNGISSKRRVELLSFDKICCFLRLPSLTLSPTDFDLDMARIVPMASSIKPSLTSLKFSPTARFALPRSSPTLCRNKVASLHLSSGTFR